jgi:hypothetical protein
MATPELRCPITARMSGSLTSCLALATPTSGLAWSSKGTSSTLKPRASMGLLSCSMASWAPFLIPSPRAAWPPESGLWVAILMVPFTAGVGVAAGAAGVGLAAGAAGAWVGVGVAAGTQAASSRLNTVSAIRILENFMASSF